MLLYWLRLFKEFGVPGHIDKNDKETEFLRLAGTADKFATTIATQIDVPVPTPFSTSWMNDPPPDLALKLFDAIHTLLGLTPPDPSDSRASGLRLIAVTTFSQAMESIYQSVLRQTITSKSANGP